MLLNCVIGEDSWESLGLQGVQPRKSVLNIHWKDWCWSWNSNTLATWCEELTHLKRPWCWDWLKAGGEGDDRGWDGWMASPTQCTWVWVNSGSWWWIGGRVSCSHGVAKSLDTTERLNWTELIVFIVSPSICHELMRPDAMILVFWTLSFKPAFSLSSFTSSRGSFFLHFLPYGWCNLPFLGYWYFSWQSWFQILLHLPWHFALCNLHIIK